jgi:hypothetical protein
MPCLKKKDKVFYLLLPLLLQNTNLKKKEKNKILVFQSDATSSTNN